MRTRRKRGPSRTLVVSSSPDPRTLWSVAATIAMQETGVEAAAATAVILGTLAAEIPTTGGA
jgi:hypothetical protein